MKRLGISLVLWLVASGASTVRAPADADKTMEPARTPAASNPMARCGSAEGPAQEPARASPTASVSALIPRKQFFDNPERNHPRLSPDGSQLAYLAPVHGVLNLWTRPVCDGSAAKPVTRDQRRGIRSFSWAHTSRHLLYLQDQDGDEDYHVCRVDLKTGAIQDLTPLAGIRARLEGVSDRFPEEILVGINDRGTRQFHDMYRVNVVTGERTLVQENPGFAAFVFDDAYRARFAVRMTPDGGQLYHVPTENEGWRPFLEIGFPDAMTTKPIGFDATGDKLYLLDSRGRETAALKVLDLKTGSEDLLAENCRVDISGALLHPSQKHVQAVSCTDTHRQWTILDDSIAGDFEYLRTVAAGDIDITSRTQDDRLWIVAFDRDNGPTRFYLYHRPDKNAEYLFTTHPSLENLWLVRMHPQLIPARDGLAMVSYLSLPAGSDPTGTGRPDHALPMVLLVHGGPWSRDAWGYDPLHQWLANRGYAVLAVNYRGSSGFGKGFLNAGNREWGRKMQDDLLDAVGWAVEQRIAEPGKVAIMGGSYGGYATLVALAFTPEVFACGIDLFGPSNLVTLWENAPPYWIPAMSVMKARVGDHTTREGRTFLESRSPLFFAGNIQRPLLIAQGKNDPRCKPSESAAIVRAMLDRDVPVTYLLFEDEGHGFARPENRFAFLAAAEGFLARYLGGRHEPIGNALDGAALTVPAGKSHISGLPEALSHAATAHP